MPGMNSGLNVSDPAVVAAFKAALVHQGLIALLIFALLGLAWVTVRTWTPAAAGRPGQRPARAARRWPSPPGGGCCASASACCGSSTGSCRPSRRWRSGSRRRSSSRSRPARRGGCSSVVNWAGTTWSYHPMQAGASAVWIQVGIGIWLLVAARGPLSRLAGLASVGWGLVVWVFGESFGGIFAPGLTWLFGAPGAVLIYCRGRRADRAARAGLAHPAAGPADHGRARAVPDRAWRCCRPGRAAGSGRARVARPARHPGRDDPVDGRHVRSRASCPPGSTRFTTFDEAHGFAVNLVAVAALAVHRRRVPERAAAADPPGR